MAGAIGASYRGACRGWNARSMLSERVLQGSRRPSQPNQLCFNSNWPVLEDACFGLLSITCVLGVSPGAQKTGQIYHHGRKMYTVYCISTGKDFEFLQLSD